MPYGAKASEEGEGYEEIPGNHVGWQLLGNMYSSNVYGGDFSIEENYDKAFELCNEALAAANPSDDYTIDHAHEWIDLIANNT